MPALAVATKRDLSAPPPGSAPPQHVSRQAWFRASGTAWHAPCSIAGVLRPFSLETANKTPAPLGPTDGFPSSYRPPLRQVEDLTAPGCLGVVITGILSEDPATAVTSRPGFTGTARRARDPEPSRGRVRPASPRWSDEGTARSWCHTRCRPLAAVPAGTWGPDFGGLRLRTPSGGPETGRVWLPRGDPAARALTV